MTDQNQTPQEDLTKNMRMNAQGHYVPLNKIKPYEKRRDVFVKAMMKKAKIEAKRLGEFKVTSMADIEGFMKEAAEEYSKKWRGSKGNVSIVSFDGLQMIKRQMQDNKGFDERMQVVKEMIMDVARRISAKSNNDVKALIEHILEVDKEGNISQSKMFELMSYPISDPEWKEAMQVLQDSIITHGTSSYIRFYERDDIDQKWQVISVDLGKS